MASVDFDGLESWIQSEENWAEKALNEVVEVIEQTALKVERDAKFNTPVDTGNLRHSITAEVLKSDKKVHAEIGSDVEYSEFVEFGTSNQKAQPFLIPSFDENVGNLEKAIADILRR